MAAGNHPGDGHLGIWIGVIIVALVMLLRAREIGRERVLKLRWVWVVPVLVVSGIAFMVSRQHPDAAQIGGLALGALLGLPLGWHRGKLTALRLDEPSGALMMRPSAASMLLLMGLVAARQYARFQMMDMAPSPWLDMASEALLGMAIGSVIAFRVELALRGRRLLGGL
jgi:hypothetical protein